jgi:hypothetical protein
MSPFPFHASGEDFKVMPLVGSAALGSDKRSVNADG